MGHLEEQVPAEGRPDDTWERGFVEDNFVAEVVVLSGRTAPNPEAEGRGRASGLGLVVVDAVAHMDHLVSAEGDILPTGSSGSDSSHWPYSRPWFEYDGPCPHSRQAVGVEGLVAGACRMEGD